MTRCNWLKMDGRKHHLESLRAVYARAVESVHPQHLHQRERLLGPVEQQQDGRLTLLVKDHRFDVTHKRCHLVGFGKAVLAMAVEVERALGPLLKGGILSLPKGCLQQFPRERDALLQASGSFKCYEGAENNLPDEVSLKAAKHIQRYAQSMTSEDILFVLITGGGSALLPLPRPPLTLDEKGKLLKDLANKGASIQELNRVRIALSDIKGGRLAAAASGAHAIVSLIISDIVGDPVHLIASGPTIYPSKEEQILPSKALEIVQLYGLASQLKGSVRHLLEHPEFCPVNRNSFIYVVGSNQIAVAAAEKEALSSGYLPFTLTTQLQGSIQTIEQIYIQLTKDIRCLRSESIDGKAFAERVNSYVNSKFPASGCDKLAEIVRASAASGKPLLIIAAGEPTVQVTGSGLGGRNQELALRLSLRFHSDPELSDNVYFLSAGTDGIDGPTPAAGAIGTSMVIEEFLNSGTTVATPTAYLRNSDSYNFYKSLPNASDYHIVTGHTGTNVMDIHLLLICS